MNTIEDFLFADQRRRIEKFQSLPAWKQYLALPVVLIGSFFQVMASSLTNGLYITLFLLLSKPIDSWRRWKAMRRGQLYTSFFD